jgi:hypothetical protein
MQLKQECEETLVLMEFQASLELILAESLTEMELGQAQIH